MPVRHVRHVRHVLNFHQLYLQSSLDNVTCSIYNLHIGSKTLNSDNLFEYCFLDMVNQIIAMFDCDSTP